MKLLGFVILLIYAQSTFACKLPIILQVGPFFSTTFIQKYWADFAFDIESQTHCQVQILASRSYEDYLNTLITNQGDIFIAPNHYVMALVKLGLTPIIRSTDEAQVYIISRRDIKLNGPNALLGETILVPSPYTRVYLELEKWLKQNQLENKVTFDFNHSHDSAMLLMLQGKYSTAVLLGAIYETFPDFIKAKYPVIKLKAQSGASILTKKNAKSELNTAILKAKDKLNFLNWEKATTPLPHEPFSAAFSKQLHDYTTNKANNRSR